MLTLEIGSFEAWRFWFRFAVSALQSHKCDEVHLRGHDSNHDLPLGIVLEWVSEGSGMGRGRLIAAPARTKRLGNGVVQRAVIHVLAGADRALSVADLHRAVEERLGQPVSRHSVRSSLASGARGAAPAFERTAPGCYRLACPSEFR
jgi:hypothetical protein